jgi:hypothetical protein
VVYVKPKGTLTMRRFRTVDKAKDFAQDEVPRASLILAVRGSKLKIVDALPPLR